MLHGVQMGGSARALAHEPRDDAAVGRGERSFNRRKKSCAAMHSPAVIDIEDQRMPLQEAQERRAALLARAALCTVSAKTEIRRRETQFRTPGVNSIAYFIGRNLREDTGVSTPRNQSTRGISAASPGARTMQAAAARSRTPIDGNSAAARPERRPTPAHSKRVVANPANAAWQLACNAACALA